MVPRQWLNGAPMPSLAGCWPGHPLCTRQDKSSPCCAVIKLWNVSTACGMSMSLHKSGSLLGGVVHGLAKEVIWTGPQAWHCQVSGGTAWVTVLGGKRAAQGLQGDFPPEPCLYQTRNNAGHLLDQSWQYTLDLHHLLIFSASLEVRQGNSRATPFRGSHLPIVSQTRHPESLTLWFWNVPASWGYGHTCVPFRWNKVYTPAGAVMLQSTMERPGHQGLKMGKRVKLFTLVMSSLPHLSNGRSYHPDFLPGWWWGSKRPCEWTCLVHCQGHTEAGDNYSWLGGNTHSGRMREHLSLVGNGTSEEMSTQRLSGSLGGGWDSGRGVYLLGRMVCKEKVVTQRGEGYPGRQFGLSGEVRLWRGSSLDLTHTGVKGPSSEAMERDSLCGSSI